MKGRGTKCSGFTALELAISVGLLTLSLAAALSGWLYLVQGERINSLQMELDIDVRSAMEWIKNDLRLSSLDHIYFYPPGAGPYTAISMPLPVADTNGLVQIDPDTGKIIWGETVIYHRWNSIPNELRVTTFRQRNNSLTPEQRREQLESVVVNGNGDNTYESEGPHETLAIFKNLFHWSLSPEGGVVDAYSEQLGVRRNYALGSIVLGPGQHTIQFTAVGKNPASTGFKFGLDDLVVSPCGVEREAEACLPATEELGGTCSPVLRIGGAWGGNYDLTFTGTKGGDYFTLTVDNDRWLETNFRGTGVLAEGTRVVFDPALSPQDFVVRLEGGPGETNWYAWHQTGEPWDSCRHEGDIIGGCAVRVLIRGGEMLEGGYLHFNGGNVAVRFDAGKGNLKLNAAYIAECASSTTPTPDAKPGTSRQLFFGADPVNGIPGTASSITLGQYGDTWATPAAGTSFPIDKEKSYLVTFLVGTGGGVGNPEYWIQDSTNTPGCYIIPASANPAGTNWWQDDWSSLPYQVTNRLYVVKFLRTSYATNGTFTSQIVDTHLSSPQFQSLWWNAVKPAGTALGLKIRSGENADLSDAPDWDILELQTEPPISLSSLPSKRYVQWRAYLASDGNPNMDLAKTPKLRDVTVTWTGETRLTDIGASVTTGPDYGLYKVTVDGKLLVRGVSIDLEIFEDVMGFGGTTRRLTSAMRAVEIEPRNTGK